MVWGSESRQTKELGMGFGFSKRGLFTHSKNKSEEKHVILMQIVMELERHLMKMTMTMAMKMESKAMEIIFPTGSGRDSLDLHDLNREE